MRSGGDFPHVNRGDVAEWVRVFLPCVPSIAVGPAGAEAQVQITLGAGTPVVTDVNALGFGGVQPGADGEDYHWLTDIPFNLSTEAPVKISAVWSTDSVDVAESALWKILYAQFAFGEALAAAATALDTAIADDPCEGVAYAIQKTEAGLIDSATLDPAKMLHILCELDTSSGGLAPGADVVILHGIMIEYLRAKL